MLAGWRVSQERQKGRGRGTERLNAQSASVGQLTAIFHRASPGVQQIQPLSQHCDDLERYLNQL